MMNISAIIVAALLAVAACNGQKDSEVPVENLTEKDIESNVDTLAIIDQENESPVNENPDQEVNEEQNTGDALPKEQGNAAAGSTMPAGHYHMVVSFFSPGMGINREAHEKFKGFLGENSKVLRYEPTRWGREGEIDYCIMYEGDAAVHPDRMNRKIRETLKGFDRINFSENSPCVHKR